MSELTMVLTLREAVFSTVTLRELMQPVIEREPLRVEVTGYDSHLYVDLDGGLELDELKDMIRSSMAAQFSNGDYDGFLEGMGITADEAAAYIMNADPSFLFQVERSFKRTDSGYLYYIERTAC